VNENIKKSVGYSHVKGSIEHVNILLILGQKDTFGRICEIAVYHSIQFSCCFVIYVSIWLFNMLVYLH